MLSVLQKAVEQIGESGGKTVEDEGEDIPVTKTEATYSRAGEVLASQILLTGWQRIVETLSNTVALSGMRIGSNFKFSSFPFFVARRSFTSTITDRYGRYPPEHLTIFVIELKRGGHLLEPLDIWFKKSFNQFSTITLTNS